MAVVLWQPPANAVENIRTSIVRREQEENRNRRELEDAARQLEEDANNNEAMNNFNWNPPEAGTGNRQLDIEMDEDL